MTIIASDSSVTLQLQNETNSLQMYIKKQASGYITLDIICEDNSDAKPMGVFFSLELLDIQKFRDVIKDLYLML